MSAREPFGASSGWRTSDGLGGRARKSPPETISAPATPPTTKTAATRGRRRSGGAEREASSVAGPAASAYGATPPPRGARASGAAPSRRAVRASLPDGSVRSRPAPRPARRRPGSASSCGHRPAGRLDLGAQRRVGGEPPLEAPARALELPQHVRRVNSCRVHGVPSSSPIISRSLASPRTIRVFTVPRGVPVRSAISLCDSPS